MLFRSVITRPVSHDTHRFEFVLPAKPWSFQGRLTGLCWAVEAVLLPTRACARAAFTLSPDGQTIPLHRADQGDDGTAE